MNKLSQIVSRSKMQMKHDQVRTSKVQAPIPPTAFISIWTITFPITPVSSFLSFCTKIFAHFTVLDNLFWVNFLNVITIYSDKDVKKNVMPKTVHTIIDV